LLAGHVAASIPPGEIVDPRLEGASGAGDRRQAEVDLTARGRSARGPIRFGLGLFVAGSMIATLTAPVQAVAATLYVDNHNGACSNAGPGTSSLPYCTISAAASVASAGQTVLVDPGVYPESVTVKNSGTPSAPVVFAAAPGAAVTVTGGGALAHGFTLSSKSWITVRGFNVTSTTGAGIYVSGGSHVMIADDHVSYAGLPVSGKTAPGIQLSNTTDSVVSGNVCERNTKAGIYLASYADRNQVVGNTTTKNAAGYTRMAPGIDVRTSSNTVAYNVSHDNEDSGLQFYTGAGSNFVFGNVSYANGDHGIDDLNAPNQVIVGNSIYGNVTAGINLEGSSTGGTVENNVSVDNGINSPRTSSNIRFDSVSVSGASADYNEVFLHAGSIQFIWGKTSYTSLSALKAATGQESHGIQADPAWRAPGSGDFQLSPGSPAIDSGDSAAPGEPILDAAGNGRFDDAGTPNTGAGPRLYDDRGAYEFQTDSPPKDAPPSAALSATPRSGSTPLQVTADASASTDTDQSPIATYRFDFGDGTVVGPQAGATATHTYTDTGTYAVTVRVTDTAGLSATAPGVSVVVSGSQPTNLVGNPGFELGLTGWNTSGSDPGVSLTRVAGGHGGGWAALLTNTLSGTSSCTLNDSPNWVPSTSGGTYTGTVWVRSDTPGQTLKLRFREYNGSSLVSAPTTLVTLTSSWQQVVLTYTPSVAGSTLDLNAFISKAPAGTCFYADDISIVKT
jgi:parallel beta-helix repeat protein